MVVFDYCVHGKYKSHCIQCDESGLCSHGKDPMECPFCTTKSVENAVYGWCGTRMRTENVYALTAIRKQKVETLSTPGSEGAYRDGLCYRGQNPPGVCSVYKGEVRSLSILGREM